ncbi:hypothetical protein Nepgr_031449 [Nepenthes gracilis]|uniref:Secreted protein n=1 Tax=Nepenthes gracilis TaxID=150966 RepID=A0AAD3TI52_NEPGR|nr:hypothetical protein Nepgr_031449 [Nepenthes gracilis]
MAFRLLAILTWCGLGCRAVETVCSPPASGFSTPSSLGGGGLGCGGSSPGPGSPCVRAYGEEDFFQKIYVRCHAADLRLRLVVRLVPCRGNFSLGGDFHRRSTSLCSGVHHFRLFSRLMGKRHLAYCQFPTDGANVASRA